VNIINLDIKYRPRNFSEFKGNEKIVKDIKALLRVGDIPHLMFVGPPGVGKTTLALLIARGVLGRPIHINTRDGDPDFKELNASSERGIDVVREIIEEYARVKPLEGTPYRFILLDEIDSSTKEFQHALRPVIEKNEDRCKFILCLNRIQGIKEPALISRCATFFFQKPDTNVTAKLLLDIAEKEGVKFEDNKLAYDVAKYYKGDLRHILNDCLETLRGYDEVITRKHLWKVYEKNGKTVAERVYESENPKEEFFTIYRKEAFDVREFLEEYFKLLGDKAIPYSKEISKIDARIRNYCNVSIQMSYFFSLFENQKGEKNIGINTKFEKPF